MVYTTNDAGQGLSVDFNGMDYEGQKNLVVPTGGMRVLKTDGEGDISVGSVQVRSDRPLEGVILFGGSVGVAEVGASEVLRRGFAAPLKSNAEEEINTGIAIMNLTVWNPVSMATSGGGLLTPGQ